MVLDEMHPIVFVPATEYIVVLAGMTLMELELELVLQV
jgi:hypothetical protein